MTNNIFVGFVGLLTLCRNLRCVDEREGRRAYICGEGESERVRVTITVYVDSDIVSFYKVDAGCVLCRYVQRMCISNKSQNYMPIHCQLPHPRIAMTTNIIRIKTQTACRFHTPALHIKYSRTLRLEFTRTRWSGMAPMGIDATRNQNLFIIHNITQ